MVLAYTDGRVAVYAVDALTKGSGAAAVFACCLTEPRTVLPCVASLDGMATPKGDAEFQSSFVELRVERVTSANGTDQLCVVGVTHLSEIVVYYAHESSSGRALCLQRLPLSANGRRKKGARRTSVVTSIQRVSVEGRSGLMVSVDAPTFILGDRGMPLALPVSFPEVPYCNPGRFFATSMSCAGAQYCLNLWCEGGNMASLGIYQCMSGLEMRSSSDMTFHRVRMGKTCHSCKEIMPLTDDSTELSMLKRDQTFLAVSSLEKGGPFINEVLTAEEQEEEQKNYERFFDVTKSYQDPSSDFGPVPPVMELEYDLSIIQAGIAVDTYPLERGEHVMDSAVLSMNTAAPGGASVRRMFVAAATNISDKHGDDTQGEGRLLLFAIDYAQFQSQGTISVKSVGDEEKEGEAGAGADRSMDVEGEQSKDQGQSEGAQTAAEGKEAFLESIRPKLRLLWEGPGPASIVQQMGKYVLSTVGARLYVYKFVPETMELEQISFYIAHFFIQSVSVVNDYILIGDARQSVQFLVWREADHALTLLGRDYDQSCALSSGYIVDDSTLGMVVADKEANLRLLQYNPRRGAESKMGYRLLNLAEFHLGSNAQVLIANQMLSLPEGVTLATGAARSKLSSKRVVEGPSPLTRLVKNKCKRFGLIVCGYDGSVGVMQPVDERVYRRLALLQQIMGWIVPAHFGLNSRDFRRLKTFVPKPFTKSGVLDGKLLSKFVLLEPLVQADVVAAMGTTVDTIMENLQDLDSAVSSF